MRRAQPSCGESSSARDGQRGGAGEVERELADRLLQHRPAELEDGRGRVRLAAGGVGDDAQRGELEGEQVVLQLGDAGADERVVHQVAGRRLEGGQRALGGAHRRDADALVAEEELRDRPALAGLADQQVARHADVGEPHLVDLVAAVDQLDRPHLDAGGGHVDEQHRDAGLLLHLGVGAHQREDPVAVLAERGPRLLAVDDPVVAVAHGRRAEAGEVGAGVGLGEALRPPDVEVGGLRAGSASSAPRSRTARAPGRSSRR